MKNNYILILMSIFVISCGTKEVSTTISIDLNEDNTVSIVESDNEINDSITTEFIGIAANRKSGAVVINDEDGEHYWIDGLDSWDDTYLNQKVLVTGELEERNDMPVFLDTSEVKMQGVPVYSEEELESSKNRIWIINAHYELVK